MWSYLKPYKQNLKLMWFFGIGSAILNALIPYLGGKIIDGIIKPNFINLLGRSINSVLLIIVIFFVTQLIISIVERYISNQSKKIGAIIQIDFYTSAISRLLHLPVAFHKKHKIGEIIHKVHMAGNSMEQLSSNVFSIIAPQFLSIFVALIFAVAVNFYLAIVLLIGVTIYIFVALKEIGPIGELQRKTWGLYNKFYGNAYDAVANVIEVKKATTEEYEVRKNDMGFKNQAIPSWLKMTKIWDNLSFYQRIIILGTTVFIYLLSIYFINIGEMTVGTLIMFNGYAAMFFGPFVSLSHNWQNLQNGIIQINKVNQMLDVPQEIYNPKSAVHLNNLTGKIEFQNVDFYYNKNQAVLKNINLEIKQGEVVALVGKSGEGKSTLIDLISGFHFPKKGKVLIDGVDVHKINLKFLRSNIGVVSQEVVLFNDTIEKNLKYGKFNATKKEVVEAARKAYADEFIEKFPKKWNQVVGERGIKLSVGQKQRVAIARAILRDPKILVLDEPTSALDAHSEKHITESLEELMKDRTTIIIAHRLSTVKRADKIVVIEGGQIVEIGKHNDLIQKENGVYRELYELQVGLHN